MTGCVQFHRSDALVILRGDESRGYDKVGQIIARFAWQPLIVREKVFCYQST